MRVLVTGSRGLIGSAVVRVNKKHEIIQSNKSELDLRDYSKTLSLFKSESPDAIIHCAALVGGIGGNLMKSGEYFRDNILINTNVLEAARESGVNNLVAFMSTCIFPNEATYPLTTDQLHKGEPHPSNFGYAYAKRMLDIQVRAYNAQWKTNFKILIPTNVYGIHDNFSLTEGHVVPALIHKMYISKQYGTPIEIWGTGNPKREFVFSEDVAQVALKVIEIDDLKEPLIITNGLETSIKELSGVIGNLIDLRNDVYFDSTKPDGQMRKPSSKVEFDRYFPEFAFTSLDEGIKKTIDWFVENYPMIRM